MKARDATGGIYRKTLQVRKPLENCGIKGFAVLSWGFH